MEQADGAHYTTSWDTTLVEHAGKGTCSTQYRVTRSDS